MESGELVLGQVSLEVGGDQPRTVVGSNARTNPHWPTVGCTFVTKTSCRLEMP